MASVLKGRLEQAAGPQPGCGHASTSPSCAPAGGWSWVPRDNRAAQHPTDFALVELGPGAAAVDEFESALRRQLGAAFRDMHPDRRFSGRLKGLQGSGDAVSGDQGGGGGGSGSGGGTVEAAAAGGAAEGAPDWDDVLSVKKPPGRLQTKPTIGLDPSDPSHREELRRRLRLRLRWRRSAARRRRARALLQGQDAGQGGGVAAMLSAPSVWEEGFTGKGVKVGVFDTGIREDHPHVRHIKDRTNWTHQDSLADGLGHGTFVAGVIAGSDAACLGFAPDIELHTFKVFTDDQVSYTSWFLDAFNYAMESGVHVINLSIGGPDYLDAPFVDKVQEVTASGILMVSAIGNDGPLWGTLNNPADNADVIGVGGVDNGGEIASFSSRGMTTHELPVSTGRVKPDVMAYAKDVSGSRIQGGCRQLSGTSVASPVVAGVVALLASTVPEATRWSVLNPASMKQALIEGAARLRGRGLYEQGAGRVDMIAAKGILDDYSPRASLFPAKLNFTDCPYMWPHCEQPLYAFRMPLAFNATVLNGLGASGRFARAPRFEAANEAGQLLEVSFTHAEVLWPWSGWLGIFVEVSPVAWNFSGVAEGEVIFTIESPPPWGSDAPRRSTVRVPLTAHIAPTPPKARRVLWDQIHSVRYPPGYIPRDNLDIKSDILDWHGDHPYTNYYDMYTALIKKGYYLEILSSPVTCVDLRNYGSYLVVDSEDEWYPQEVAAVEAAVKQHGLQLIVFAEWYHADSLTAMKFFDDNTRSWWTPATGGANVPALNELLAPHGVALGDAIVQGSLRVAGMDVPVSYGTSIWKFPAGGAVHAASLSDFASKGGAKDPSDSGARKDAPRAEHAVLGRARSGAGGVAVFGDSNCLDHSHRPAALWRA
ncbi:hypothetical protein MNEG_10128 [Monoraphidium neglectum]|uniref:Uncharacterized protein n=1 Tax=Monoraphidium neglectum TaxID=145388 RepID=A0A0D2MTR6_9CHLO|nr:hypothetical protein MNEG_10128 [Monoraphidium neglectum]KIY97835.1 hypothetical protein MNEG_10128 [Monoraphidium neglectum]|eukprot:XP_013896855.1 hypothetical protein MNEG_10128 [Monoraphidium neglectum]